MEMQVDLLGYTDGSLYDILKSYEDQVYDSLRATKISTAGFTYFMRKHFYHKQWLFSLPGLGNEKRLPAAKTLALLARLGIEEIPNVNSLASDESDEAEYPRFLNHLYDVFKKQQILHHQYLNREDEAQIAAVQEALKSTASSSNHDPDKLNEYIRNYYYQILHQEDYKENKDYALIDEDEFRLAIEGVCSASYKTVLYDLRILAKRSREKARALREERALLRASIDSVALACNLPLRIVPIDDLRDKNKTFSIDAEGYHELKSHADSPQYHFPAYRVIDNEKKEATGAWQVNISPIETTGFRDKVRKEYRTTYYTAGFAAIAALLIGIGEGGVAADEIYKKLEDHNKVFAVVSLGCVFVGGAITNYFLTCDDTKWFSDQWLNKKIFKDRFGQPVSWCTCLIIAVGILAALSAGASLGALEWQDNAELVGKIVAIPSAAMATIGFTAIFHVVLSEFIKENIFKLIGMYLADCSRYIRMLWQSNNCCYAFIKSGLFIVFEIVKVAVGQSLNFIYALANYYVFSAITDFFSFPVSPELASFVAIVFVATDALWGGRKVQQQINGFFNSAYETLFGDKTHTKSQRFNTYPINDEQNDLEKSVNNQFKWKRIISYGSLILNTVGMVALNAQDETLDVLSKNLGIDNYYILMGLIIASTSFRSGLPNKSAMDESFSKGVLTPFSYFKAIPEVSPDHLEVGGKNDIPLDERPLKC